MLRIGPEGATGNVRAAAEAVAETPKPTELASMYSTSLALTPSTLNASTHVS